MTLSSEGTATISGLVDEVLDSMNGYVRTQEQSTTLAGDIDSTQLTFTVDEPQQISRGLVEIDDELVFVTGTDSVSGDVTIPAWGRGQRGTAQVAHTAGARVTTAPLYPRQLVAKTVFGILREIFPDVYAVGEVSFDVDLTVTNYEMPSDAYHVLNVEWNPPGPTGMWVPVERWRQNKTATAVELELISYTFPGTNRARVKYVKLPPIQLQGTDSLQSYGYDNQVRDLVVLGAVARLCALTEPSRLQTTSLESHARSEAVPAGSAVNAARFIYQLFRQRLEDERRQIMLRHPIQPHRTR